MLDKIQYILSEYFGVKDILTEETRISDVGIDSMQFLEVLFHVEEEYDVTLDPSIASDINTIGDLIEKVKKELE